MTTKTALSEWLEKQYLTWQLREGRGTIGEFAQWLGVSRNTYNNWTSRGQVPRGKYLTMLARQLGPEIYDVLGVPRPDPRLQQIISQWGSLPEGTRNLMTTVANSREAELDILRLAAQLDADSLDELSALVDRVSARSPQHAGGVRELHSEPANRGPAPPPRGLTGPAGAPEMTDETDLTHPDPRKAAALAQLSTQLTAMSPAAKAQVKAWILLRLERQRPAAVVPAPAVAGERVWQLEPPEPGVPLIIG